MAGIQAPVKALYYSDDLAHNKIHNPSRLFDHNTTESTDNIKRSADVSLAQNIMDVHLRKKLLSYYNMRYNSLLLQRVIDYSSSLRLQLECDLSMLRIMRQINSEST
uniref:Uncharacterized protein n=1 Tax=Ditylum brightwellii TaxID=49249 RepID=A0A7S4RPJ6_9STRA